MDLDTTIIKEIMGLKGRQSIGSVRRSARPAFIRVEIMATETKHTPGPWKTGCRMTRVEVLPAGWNAPMCIADCGTKYSPESEEEKCANARLIAAAPELLEACKIALQAINECDMEVGLFNATEQEITDKLYAAIAQAKSA